jgi:hypothetical protein
MLAIPLCSASAQHIRAEPSLHATCADFPLLPQLRKFVVLVDNRTVGKACRLSENRAGSRPHHHWPSRRACHCATWCRSPAPALPWPPAAAASAQTHRHCPSRHQLPALPWQTLERSGRVVQQPVCGSSRPRHSADNTCASGTRPTMEYLRVAINTMYLQRVVHIIVLPLHALLAAP